MVKINKIVLSSLFLIVLAYFTTKPLFTPGFFPMHDDTQPTRIFEMAKALQDGMFPVRWVADMGYGYGYPIFNFYAPFAYYSGALIHLMGFDALIATKVLIGVGFVFSGLSMYLLARTFWGEMGGIASGMLFLFAPYHALNIYVRGDLAEFWATLFVPLVFYGLWHAYRTKQWRYVVIGSLSYAAIISSHNLTAIMVTPFLFITALVLAYLSFRQNDKARFYYSLSVFLGVLLSAFYWLPVPVEMHYTNVIEQIGGNANFRLHFVCPRQLWDSPWGFAGSAYGCIDGMSYRIGKLHLLIAGASVFATIIFWRKDKERFWILTGALLCFLFGIFLTLSYSKFIWELIPVMPFFQYPWRFLLVISFFSSFLGGALFYVLEFFISNKFTRVSVQLFGLAGLTCAILLLYAKLFIPQTIVSKNVADYASETALKWTRSKISDEYLPPYFQKPEASAKIITEKVIVQKGKADIKIEENRTQKLRAQIAAEENAIVLVQTAYFPAWKAYLDNEEYEYKITKNGLVLDIPRGEHTLVMQFVQTPIEKGANLLSLAGIAVLLTGIIKSPVSSHQEKKGKKNHREKK